MQRLSLDTLLFFILKAAGFKSRYTATSVGDIHCFVNEAKHPKGDIVLVHGIGSWSVHFWEIAIALRKKGYSVYIPDLPGHGKNPDLEGPDGFVSIYQMFEEWAQKALPRKKLIMVGSSLGGAIALRYGLENGKRLKRLMVISPAGGFTTEEDWEDFKSSMRLASVTDCKALLSKVYTKRPLYFPLLYKPFLAAMLRPMVRDVMEKTRYEDLHIDSVPVEADAIAKTLPMTLVVWGKSEKLFGPHHLEKFRKTLPKKVTFEEPQHVGHAPHLDNPKWMIKRILQFCEPRA